LDTAVLSGTKKEVSERVNLASLFCKPNESKHPARERAGMFFLYANMSLQFEACIHLFPSSNKNFVDNRSLDWLEPCATYREICFTTVELGSSKRGRKREDARARTVTDLWTSKVTKLLRLPAK